MAKALDVEFNGTENLEQIFEKLPQSLNRSIMLKVFRRAAKPVQQAIKRHTPVRVKVRQGQTAGNLLKSVGTITGKSKKYPTLYIGPRAGKKFSNDGWYAKFLTKGTKHIKANPFVQRGWDESETAANGIIEKECAAIIDKTLKKYAVND